MMDVSAEDRAPTDEEFAKLLQAFAQKRPLPGGRVRLAPIRGLNDIEGQDGPGLRRPGKRQVIDDTQVPFEPDELGHAPGPFVASSI